MTPQTAQNNHNTKPHIPVMLDEVLSFLAPKDGAIYLDGTFGAGGYSRALLGAAECCVYAIDRDPQVQSHADALLRDFPSRFTLLMGNFSDMEALLAECGITAVDGIVLDLGVSSMQLDQADRGFSFQKDGPLDMRMGGSGPSAADVVNTASEQELADIIYTYGEEHASRRIAKAIVKARAEAPLATTGDLARVIHSVLQKGKSKIDPATRTFQALRIWVNDELNELEQALHAAERLLKANGRLVLVSFHSLEDRIVKAFLKQRSQPVTPPVSRHLPPPPLGGGTPPLFTLLTRKAVQASDGESSGNARSRSAKLRAAVRTGAALPPGV
ncbi:MAG: 16S rRNA (cytosine(1402)-N(4))-methyltransferase RsmH [Alphaproteobacteria bacterium]|nr:16S rRNA (cytosine(1402)-N(4))-methyltransferase RsmH [Alphaproteobacteria bacterium]